MAKGRKTGGRAAGTPNKATGEIKELARVHGPAAISELARLATGAESETARVAAIREILDRGYGKPVQAIETLSPNERDPKDLSTAELIADIDRTLAEVKGRTGGQGEGEVLSDHLRKLN